MQSTTNTETSDKCREAEWNTTRVIRNGLLTFWLAVWRVVWYGSVSRRSYHCCCFGVIIEFRITIFSFSMKGEWKRKRYFKNCDIMSFRWIIAGIMRILDNEWEDSKHTTQQVMKVTRPQSAYPCVYVLALWKLRLEARMPALRSCYEATAVSNGKILILYGERQVDLLSLLPDFKPKKTRYESVNYQMSDYCST